MHMSCAPAALRQALDEHRCTLEALRSSHVQLQADAAQVCHHPLVCTILSRLLNMGAGAYFSNSSVVVLLTRSQLHWYVQSDYVLVEMQVKSTRVCMPD